MIRAFKMRLEYGMGPEFEKRHTEVWPEVERMRKRRFLASVRSGFLMEPFQFERVGAFGLNVERMKLRRKG